MEGYSQDLGNALFIYPDDPIALYNRAQLFLANKQWGEALEDLNRAIDNGAQSHEFYVSRAEAHIGRGDTTQALSNYNAALESTDNPAQNQEIQEAIDKINNE